MIQVQAVEAHEEVDSISIRRSSSEKKEEGGFTYSDDTMQYEASERRQRRTKVNLNQIYDSISNEKEIGDTKGSTDYYYYSSSSRQSLKNKHKKHAKSCKKGSKCYYESNDTYSSSSRKKNKKKKGQKSDTRTSSKYSYYQQQQQQDQDRLWIQEWTSVPVAAPANNDHHPTGEKVKYICRVEKTQYIIDGKNARKKECRPYRTELDAGKFKVKKNNVSESSSEDDNDIIISFPSTPAPYYYNMSEPTYSPSTVLNTIEPSARVDTLSPTLCLGKGCSKYAKREPLPNDFIPQDYSDISVEGGGSPSLEFQTQTLSPTIRPTAKPTIQPSPCIGKNCLLSKNREPLPIQRMDIHPKKFRSHHHEYLLRPKNKKDPNRH